jgi:hypothetical protein
MQTNGRINVKTRSLSTFHTGWAFVAGLSLMTAPAAQSATPAAGTTARFYTLGPGEDSQRLVTDLRLTILGEVSESGRRWVDWQMDAAFDGGREVSVRAASERAPMTGPDGCGDFLRYQLRHPDGGVFDYRHARTGHALLPPVAFRTLFLPTSDPAAALVDGFSGAGRFLAHIIILGPVTRSTDVRPVEGATVLTLRPDLLIGTSRSFRDDGKGRPSPTANYNYIRLAEKDYGALIAAGTNYFGVTAEQLKWVKHRPVFYRGPGAFPDDYYRSNYYPTQMFSDEPMIRLGWQEVSPPELDHPSQMASFLEGRVRHIYTELSPLHGIAKDLRRYNIRLDHSVGEYMLAPTWETEFWSAFHELAGGAPGIVHEGRYRHDHYGWHPDVLFGPGLEYSTREMLLGFYTFLRGAARAFDGDWGTAIYGQSDPELRVEALTLAYDLGARYLWFWTSDHDHHVEFTEQVRLTRELSQHMAAHPREPLEKLRRAASVAVVFPAGYTLSWGHMWGHRSFSFESRNRTGTPYREVVAAAMWEGVLLAKQGVPFDFTEDHPGIEKLGYEKLLMIGEDASVRVLPTQTTRRPIRPRVAVSAGETRKADPIPSSGPPPMPAMNAYGRPIQIDGQLDEWKEAVWFVQDDKPSGGGEWDGSADLTGRIAFATDGVQLFVAARVSDDRHHQPYTGWDLWNGDCVQIGLDPLNEPDEPGYTRNQNEIGFALLDSGEAVTYRWIARRNQRPRELPHFPLAIRRDEARGETIYEAALPLSEMAPLSPAVTPVIGVCVVFNDADNAGRATYHETSPGAMTAGKHPTRFMKLAFPDVPADERSRVSTPHAWATLVWGKTVAQVGGRFTCELATRSWDEQKLTIAASLAPLDPLTGVASEAKTHVVGRDQAMRQQIEITAQAAPGRYRLTLEVKDDKGAVLVREPMTVFVYP